MKDAEVALPNDIALCHELIRQQAAALEQAQRRIERLEHSVDLLLRQRYGPRSERIDPNQLRLFTGEDDDPVSSEESTVAPQCPSSEVEAHLEASRPSGSAGAPAACARRDRTVRARANLSGLWGTSRSLRRRDQ